MAAAATAASSGVNLGGWTEITRDLVDGMPVGCACFDLELRYTYINQRLAEVNGISREDHIGRHVSEVVPTLVPAVEEVVARIQATGKAVLGYLFSGETPRSPGFVRYWSESWYPLRDTKGAITGYGVIAEEITERKRAEDALRKRDEQLRLALSAGRLATWDRLFATEEVSWNDDHFLMLGYEVGEVTPSYEAWACRVHPEDREVAETAYQRSLEGGGDYSIIFRTLWPDGTVRWIETHGRLECDAAGRAVRSYGVMMDITERKRVELELGRARELMAEGERIAHVGTFEYAVDTGAVIWSEEEYRIYGLEAGTPPPPYEAMLTRHVHPDDAALVHEAFTAALQAGTVYELEHRIVRPDGTVRYVHNRAHPYMDRNGTILRYVGVTLDITERRQAETALRESERLYRAIGESIDYGIWVCDADGRNRYASESLLKLVGITREQCADFGWGDVLHPDDAADTIAAWKECVRTGSAWYREHRYLGADGKYHPILACGVPVRDERGQITAWAGINLDISRLKRAQEELAQAKAALERASAAKDRFIASLSHELRTPLAPAVAALSALSRDPRLPEDLREDVRLVERNIALEVHLVNDLLDVSRIVNGKLALRRERADLGAILRDVRQIVAVELNGKRQDLVIDAPGSPCWVDGDRARLQQVFWNLIRNSIKFSPEGARIEVEALAGEGRVRIAVRDSGQGIEPPVLSRLFRPFEQGERRTHSGIGGLGLGLAICQGIVQLHGGTISAASAGLGKGATFTVELPLATAPSHGEGRQAAAAGPARPGRPLRILLVEDHADTAKLMSRLLASDRHVVTWAGSVKEALDAASAGEFDLLLSDLGLPDGTGYDVMRGLVARGRRLRGVAVSGYGSTADVQQSLDAGFVEHITKPISIEALQEVVMRAAED